MNFLKKWWKTSVRKQVVFGEDGRPIDCKGLRFKGGQPFGEGTEYYIDDIWEDFDYLGKGMYCSPRSFQGDMKNPYYADAVRKRMEDFGQTWNKHKNRKFEDNFHEAVEECIEDIEKGKEPKFVRIS